MCSASRQFKLVALGLDEMRSWVSAINEAREGLEELLLEASARTSRVSTLSPIGGEPGGAGGANPFGTMGTASTDKLSERFSAGSSPPIRNHIRNHICNHICNHI